MHPAPWSLTLLLALHTPTFAPDPAWSKGAIQGLRAVWVTPETVATQVPPLAEAPEGEPTANGVTAGAPGLTFTNPTSTWATLRVNDVALGEISAYAAVSVPSLQAGWYAVTLTLPNGYVRAFSVQVMP